MGIEDLVNQMQGQTQGAPAQGDSVDPAHVNKLAGPLGDMLGGGGITDILGKLSGSGLGDTVKSWIGKGANLPISADSLTSILGTGVIGSLAAKVGLTSGQTSVALSQILPKVIDHMTPTGEPPKAETSSSSITDAIGKIFG